MALKIEVAYLAEIPIVHVEGKVTLGDGAAKLREAIDELLNGGKNQVVLNMAGVSYVDSSGLGAVASSVAKAANAGGRMALCEAPEQFQQLLSLTRLDDQIQVFPNENAALAGFVSPANPIQA